MASNLIGLVLTILASSNLLSAATLNQKYDGEKLNRYFDEGRWTREEELKRYKWMADESSTQSNPDSNINSGKRDVTPKAEDVVGFMNNQEKLLNAVALIKEVLESANYSEQNMVANKTDQLKVAREVLRPEPKDRLSSGSGQAYEEDEVEINKYEQDYDDKAPNYEENHQQKQMKLKQNFWNTNRDKYLRSFPSSLGKDEATDEAEDDKTLTSDNQLENFGGNQEDMLLEEMSERLPNYKRKREEPSTSTTESVNPSSTEVSTESSTESSSSTEMTKRVARRQLMLNRGARFGLNSGNGNKFKFNIRKKRIGELNYNTIEGRSKRKNYRRRCDDIGALKRDIYGCGM